MKFSIRWRLVIWNALAFGVLLTAFAGLVYLLAYREAIGGVDRKLTGCLDQLARDERNATDATRLRHWIGEFWEHEQVGCTVFDSQGIRIERTDELTPDSLPDQLLEAGNELQYATVTQPIIGRQRALSAPLPNDHAGHTVVLLASTAEVDRSMATVRLALLTAIPVAFVIAGGIAYLLAGRVLSPVTRLTQATRRITADRLGERLPVANPHDELGRLAITVNDLLARLNAAFAEQRRFTADASHELRTPLAVLRAEVEIALRNPPPATEFTGFLASLVEECDRLGKLTDQLLNLSRQDASRPHREPVELSGLLTGIVAELQSLARANEVALRLTFGEVGIVEGDSVSLRRAFVNLIENGIKYTLAGGSVEVRAVPNATYARVEVVDSGEGIPAEHLPHVFDRFYRVDKARSRRLGGAGLGLSIAESVIKSHGGSLELASEVGRGTIAAVTLPLVGNYEKGDGK